MNNLRRLDVSVCDVHIVEIIDFCQLKSLRSIRVCGVDEEDCVNPLGEILDSSNHWPSCCGKFEQPLLLPTKSLSLEGSGIPHPHLMRLLRYFPDLEHFRFSNPVNIFEPPRLLKSLRHLKHSLQSFTVTGRAYIVHWYSESVTLKGFPIGSLADFARLKIIDLDVHMLLGASSHDREGFCGKQT